MQRRDLCKICHDCCLIKDIIVVHEFFGCICVELAIALMRILFKLTSAKYVDTEIHKICYHHAAKVLDTDPCYLLDSDELVFGLHYRLDEVQLRHNFHAHNWLGNELGISRQYPADVKYIPIALRNINKMIRHRSTGKQWVLIG
jgi:hypothetical protein